MTRDEAVEAMLRQAMDLNTPVGTKLFLVQKQDEFDWCCGSDGAKEAENRGWQVVPADTMEVLG